MLAGKKLELLHGDCLEKLRTIPDSTIDVIITSPPYNLGESKGSYPAKGLWASAKIQNGYNGYSDAMPYPDYKLWQGEVLRECWRVLSDHGVIFYNHKPRIVKGEVRLPTDLNPGLPLRQVIIWNRKKRNEFRNFSLSPEM